MGWRVYFHHGDDNRGQLGMPPFGSSLTDMSMEHDAIKAPAPNRGRFLSLAPIVVFDVGGPLVAYYSLRTAGLSALWALLLSGVLPACGLVLSAVRRRRLDAVGILVLLGIMVGSVLGVVSGSAHLVLIDGIVPTAIFGVVCLGSLWSVRPLMFRLALQTMGADTAKGRDFAGLWRYAGFRHAFRVTTVVWGLAYLAEAAAQVLIIETSPIGVAKLTSHVLPLAVGAVAIAWNISYGMHSKRKGEQAAETAQGLGRTGEILQSHVPTLPRTVPAASPERGAS
jgi:hypothetical protein